MHWAIWQQMKSPPKGFEDIVRTHFRQRQKHVSVPPLRISFAYSHPLTACPVLSVLREDRVGSTV